MNWDQQHAAPRLVAGFFALADLERLLYLRQNAIPLSATLINPQIAGRIYQQEAIRRLCEAFTKGKRRALMVMATGTGKTRTTVALIDLFLSANQARKILFLADRDALVDQALRDGFHTFLPNETSDRIYTHNIDKTRRLYVATLQTRSILFTAADHRPECALWRQISHNY
jgi:type I site-specific restriction endonuclease